MSEAGIRHSSETALGVLTLVSTAIHFVLETWYHFQWGQPLQALIVDYISNALMVFAGITSLRVRPASAAGLLAAAWAYNLGFGWRSVFGRLEMIQSAAEFTNGEPPFVFYLIAGALCLVAIVLTWALWLALRQARLKP